MSDFLVAFNRSMEFEGRVLSNTPGDAGRTTFFGISRRFNPQWSGWTLIDGMTKEEVNSSSTLASMAEEFYETVIWNRNHIGDIEDQLMANYLFDTIINPGPVCIKVLQGLAAAVQDGVIGQQTVDAINGKMQTGLLDSFAQWRRNYYHDDVVRNPDKAIDLDGWLNRCVIS